MRLLLFKGFGPFLQQIVRQIIRQNVHLIVRQIICQIVRLLRRPVRTCRNGAADTCGKIISGDTFPGGGISVNSITGDCVPGTAFTGNTIFRNIDLRSRCIGKALSGLGGKHIHR